MAFHDLKIGIDVHVPHAFEYADSTARESATGFDASHVGRLARQLDDNSLWILTSVTPTWAPVHKPTKEDFFGLTTYDANKGSYRTVRLDPSETGRFNFKVPHDFNSISNLALVVSVQAGADIAGQDIDLNSDYGLLGESFNQNQESDTTTTYDFTGTNNDLQELDITGVFSNLAAGHYCGLQVDTGATFVGQLRIYGIRLRYQ